MHKEHVYLGVGSNLENPIKRVTDAFSALHTIEDTRVLKTSSLYSSKPMGPQDQPDYINAVCFYSTVCI